LHYTVAEPAALRTTYAQSLVELLATRDPLDLR